MKMTRVFVILSENIEVHDFILVKPSNVICISSNGITQVYLQCKKTLDQSKLRAQTKSNVPTLSDICKELDTCDFLSLPKRYLHNCLETTNAHGEFDEFEYLRERKLFTYYHLSSDICLLTFFVNRVLLNLWLNELAISNFYRRITIKTFSKFKRKYGRKAVVFCNIDSRLKELIDYEWNYRLQTLAREREELDHMMSWLSTLGGAFSALGDYFTNCAEIAGKISINQFQLAIRVGDPTILARCKLFLSLSLIQCKKFKLAKQIILAQYEFAKQHGSDTRLLNMCKGIWTKLKFEMKSSKAGVLREKGVYRKLKIKKIVN